MITRSRFSVSLFIVAILSSLCAWQEITPVLEDIGAFDPESGMWKLQDVFQEAQPTIDGTVALGDFLKACDPEQAARVSAVPMDRPPHTCLSTPADLHAST